MGNPLFSGWERNVCRKSPPLGQWTRKARDVAKKAEEEIEDADDGR